MTGGAAGDTLIGDDAANVIRGGGGTDLLYGFGGNDVLAGGSAAAGEANLLDGGGGSDTADYSAETSAIYLDLRYSLSFVLTAGTYVYTDYLVSIENLTGGAAGDTLIGDDTANVIRGGGGTDLLYGFGGNDTLAGGSAAAGQANLLDGGAGSDTADYSAETSAIYVDLKYSLSFVLTAGTYVYTDYLVSIENLTGGAAGDTLIGDDAANVIRGGGGDRPAVWLRRERRLGGGSAAAGEANLLDGGAGSDTADYSAETSAIYVDLKYSLSFVLTAGTYVYTDYLVSIENLTGGAAGDTLIGDDTANVIRGGGGTDLLYGFGGNDTLAGGSAAAGQANLLDGGAGSDTADYSAETTSVYVDLNYSLGFVTVNAAYVNTDNLLSIENLTGGLAGDTLIGDAGGNRIQGGGGADQLYASANGVNDGNQDVFVFTAATDSSAVTGVDTVYNFISGQDKVDLTSLQINSGNISISTYANGKSLSVDTNPAISGFEMTINLFGINAFSNSDIIF